MKHRQVRPILVMLESFVALTSIIFGGGLAIGAIQLPVAWLQGSPFRDYAILGLVMAIIIGGGALLAVITILTQHKVSLLISAIAGLLLMAFEFVEVSIIDRNLGNWLLLVAPLQALYSALALTIVALAVYLWMIEYRHPHLHSRHANQV